MSGGPTRRDKGVEVVADLVGAGRGQLQAVARGADPATRDSGPGDLVIGIGRPQAGAAIEHRGRCYVDRGLVAEPNTRLRHTDQGVITPATGRSSLVMQMPDREAGAILNPSAATAPRVPAGRTLLGPTGAPLAQIEPPVDAAPISQLLRVEDGHLCLIGNDPQEHSPADHAYRTGGGFMAWECGGAFARTRIGDALGPLRLGIPSQVGPAGLGDTGGAAGTVPRTSALEQALRPVAPGGHAAEVGR
jgi:hypothetical protein